MNDYLTLPFSPTDLVKIYSSDQKVLKVNLEESIKNIPIPQLLVYISNTKFEVEFNNITDDLLVYYIESNFNVKCKQIDEIIVGAIYNPNTIPSIKSHVEDIRKLIMSIPNYVLDNIEKYSEGKIEADTPNFTYIDTPLLFGLNAIKLLDGCQLLMIKLLKEENITNVIYTFYMNDKPKFQGNDFYHYLYTHNYIKTTLAIVGDLVKEKENSND